MWPLTRLSFNTATVFLPSAFSGFGCKYVRDVVFRESVTVEPRFYRDMARDSKIISLNRDIVVKKTPDEKQLKNNYISRDHNN